MKEKILVIKAKNFIESMGGVVAKYHGSCYSESGVPDLLCGIPSKDGRLLFVGIELKSKNGQLSALQKNWLNKIREKGGIAFVAKSLEDIKEGLFWNKIYE